MLPRDYQNIYDVDDGDNILKEKWLMDLTQEEDNFVWGSINQIGTIKYWENQICNIITAKEQIPQICRIGNTCFTYLAVNGGKLYSAHPENRNHVHKDKNYLLSVIIAF